MMVAADIAAGEPNISATHRSGSQFRPLAASCVIVLAFVIWHMRGFMEAEDGAVYFGYMNNSSRVTIPFYYTGYVALYTEIVSYFASFLPFAVQPAVYAVAAAIVGIYFTYQLLIFLLDTVKAPIVSIVFAVIIVAFVIETTGTFNLFTNLTYNIWIGWMGLYLRVLNGMRGRPAGPATIVLGVLSAWSHSFCVVLVIPIAAAMLLMRDRNIRVLAELAIYLVAGVFFALFLIEPGFPQPFDKSRLIAKLAQMLFDIHSNMIVLIFMAVVLTALAVPASIRNLFALFGRRGVPIDDLLLSVLAFVGLATVAIILVSGRLLISDKIFARYLYTPFLSLFLAFAIVAYKNSGFRSWLTTVEDRLKRLMSLPHAPIFGWAFLLGFLAIAQIVAWSNVKAAYGKMIDGERFLIAAQEYRRTCTDGALIHEWDKWSLAVLCHRRELPAFTEALPLSEDHVTVQGRNGTGTTADHQKPEIPMLFQPQDVMHLPRL